MAFCLELVSPRENRFPLKERRRNDEAIRPTEVTGLYKVWPMYLRCVSYVQRVCYAKVINTLSRIPVLLYT